MVRIALILIMIFAFNSSVSFANLETKPLDDLEKQLFSYSYTKETLQSRLSRVEKEIFGRTYNDTTDKRLTRISKFVQQKPQSSNSTNLAVNKPPEITTTKDYTNYPTVTNLENKIFRKNFKGENVYSRLNRLEQAVFGAIFSNDNLSDRVDRLNSALESNKSTFSEDTGSILETPAITGSTGSVFSNVTVLEQNIFGKTFDKELITERIDRLEMKLFGAVQSGTIDNRIKTLNTIAQKSFQSNLSQNTVKTFFEDSDNFFADKNESYNNNNAQLSNGKSGFQSFLEAVALVLTSLFMNNNNDPYGYQGYNQSYYGNYPPSMYGNTTTVYQGYPFYNQNSMEDLTNFGGLNYSILPQRFP